MSFDFRIDERYLLMHALNTRQPVPFREWGSFRRRILRKYPVASDVFLRGGIPELRFLNLGNTERYLSDVKTQTRGLISEGMKSRAFRRLVAETENYLILTKRRWEKNSEIALDELQEITGLSMPDMGVTVYITHPKMKNGVSLPSLKSICWGHEEEWRNYTIVYLCHELLHLMIRGREKDEAIMHAIIELACDNELRIRLNGRGRYFKENSKDIGHQRLGLVGLEKRILPAWRTFLEERKGTIFDFEWKIVKSFRK